MEKTTLKNTIIEEIKVEDKVCGLSVVAVSNDNQYKILQITDKKIRGIFQHFSYFIDFIIVRIGFSQN